jgi:ribosome biogenesis protein ERB1
MSQAQPPKSSFIPSKWERMKVNKLVTAIKNGWIKLDEDKKPKEEDEKVYDIWGEERPEDLAIRSRLPTFIPPPKIKLPDHAESYNPPEEFLFDDEERKAWEEADPRDRPTKFMPQKHERLRHVKVYDDLIKERFERCLDLYLCPRVRKKKLNIDPESLLPKLPKPSELRPFPTMANIVYEGHEARVRAISLDSRGQFMASGDEKGTLIIWDVLTTRILMRYQLDGIIYAIEWSKAASCPALAVCVEEFVILLAPPVLPKRDVEAISMVIEEAANIYATIPEEKRIRPWEFFNAESADYGKGYRLKITFEFPVKGITFHHKGDYFATISPNTQKNNEQVYVHSLSKAASQRPFAKSKSNIQRAAFHPTKPFIFIVTQRHIYIYNLQQQALTKKLISGAKWISSIAVHPMGDNLIVGTYDRRVIWFDLDLGNTPFKTLRYHEKAVRQVTYHNVYPLFATCGDDGTVHVFHATVFNDYTQNALIVPLKILKGGHRVKDDLGVLDVIFHPLQPWVFSAGADHKIVLWT